MATLLDKLMIVNNIFAVGAGAYHGFCRAQGIEIPQKSFEAATLYGPSLLMAGFASLKSIKGEYEKNLGPVGSGVVGLLHGGIVTAAGFGLGYLVGSVMK